jgi:hypothetical protein
MGVPRSSALRDTLPASAFKALPPAVVAEISAIYRPAAEAA